MTNFRKILASVSAAVTMLTATSVSSISASALSGIRGDVNNDGYVSSADGQALQDYILGRSVNGITRESSDLNGDGTVNIFDLIIMRRILSGEDKQTLFVQSSYKIFYPGQVFLDNGKYYGVMQGDGNMVVYKRENGSISVVSASDTCYGEDYRNYKLAFQPDGNIVVYATPNYPDAKEKAIWNIRVCHGDDKNRPYSLTFDSDGNLIWNGKNNVEWTSTTKYQPEPMDEEKRKTLAEYRVGLSKNFAYHYASIDKAAIDFIYVYNEISYDTRTEYGTSILLCDDGKYRLDMTPPEGLTGPQRGENQADGKGPNIYLYPDSVAYVHTHGHRVCEANEYFSIKTDDGVTDLSIAYNHTTCQGRKCIAYLGAPNGRIWKFDPNVDNWYPAYQSQAGRIIYWNAPHRYNGDY